MAIKDKFFLVCGCVLIACLTGSIFWGIVLDNKLRTSPTKDRMQQLESRIVDLEGELGRGRDSLEIAIRESDELKRINSEITGELDGYRKRIDSSVGAIGRGSDSVSRIENLIGQIEARQPVSGN